jgi:hypothetical protein
VPVTYGGGLPPTSFPASVPTVERLAVDATALFRSGLLALLFLLLAAFPGQLFNKTWEENEKEIAGWFARGGRMLGGVRAAMSSFWSHRVGILVFVILSAMLYGFLSPDFGPSAESVASLAGILVGLLVVIAAFELPLAVAYRRLRADPGRLRVIPLTIFIAIFCVAASRLADFQPGYLYGLVAGFAFATTLDNRDEARAHAATALFMLGIAVGAWLLLPIADRALAGQPLLDLAVSAGLATIFVAGLEGLLFELVPMRFLRGQSVYQWRRSVWAVLFAVAAFLFAYILLEPTVGYLGSTRASPLLPAIVLFVAFGVASVAFWGYFRFRPPREVASSE